MIRENTLADWLGFGEASAQVVPSAKPVEQKNLKFQEWSCEPNGVYRPTCKAVERLESAVYRVLVDNRGIYFSKLNVETDSLITIDDTAGKRVIDGIRKFWDSKEIYDKYEVLYRRGVLLYGPQGGGKTSIVNLLCQDIFKMNGLVIYVTGPDLTAEGLQYLRMIEPDRPLILIFEDLDELIHTYGEHAILALLDGEYKISNSVNVATTNFPEKLGGRIINRPSRFDEKIFVDLPTEEARRRFISHLTKKDPLGEEGVDRWVKDTNKLSLAHVRELVIAVRCLGQDYKDVLDRLREMTKPPKAVPEFGAGNSGFIFQGE